MHILASPGYAPGTIAVNVTLHITWMERRFINVGQTRSSTHLSLIEIYSEIRKLQLFPTPCI